METPKTELEKLKELRDDVPPDVTPEVKTAWQNYIDARIEKAKEKQERGV